MARRKPKKEDEKKRLTSTTRSLFDPNSKICSFLNSSSPSIFETLFEATYSSSKATPGPGFVVSPESGASDLISLYDSSRRRKDVKGERSGAVVSLLSWRTSSSICGAEASLEIREASARRFWRRESLRRSGFRFRFFFEFEKKRGGREGRERGQEGGRVFRIDEKRSETKKKTNALGSARSLSSSSLRRFAVRSTV